MKNFKITESLVREISEAKSEPSWVLDFRMEALKIFNSKPMPEWLNFIGEVDFCDLVFFKKEKIVENWEDVPERLKYFYSEMGIPEFEQGFFAGVAAQNDSEVVFNQVQDYLENFDVVFTDFDTAIKEYPELVRKYLGKLVPADDNKFSAMNSALFSGGIFLHVPKDVQLTLPIHTFFLIGTNKLGQFERTMIVAEKNSKVSYMEGCAAPTFRNDLLHAAVVEVFVEEEAKVQYTTFQNWSKDVYTLVTKRAQVQGRGVMEWIDGNLGSGVTVKYPSCILVGDESHGEIISVAVAGENQIQDVGSKMIHIGKNTTSRILSKSICKDGGVANYRGLVKMTSSTKNSKSSVSCDALIMDEKSRTSTFPKNIHSGESSIIEHEATVSKISEEKLFYLRSRGFSEEKANAIVVGGFIEPVLERLPETYSSELLSLIHLDMEGSVG